MGSLVSDGTFLYGTTSQGGSSDLGTIFKVRPDGTGYVKLFNFPGGAIGSIPQGSLMYDGTFLYGMTYSGGTSNLGIIFKIKPDGTGFAKLLDFTGANGSNPNGALITDGTFLYGMTYVGGVNNLGTIFKINPDGTGYLKLLDFAGNTNGSNPLGSLFFDGTFLYGMTQSGGINTFFGVIFKILPDGTGYATLHDFAAGANGKSPAGSLISDGTFLYGMTADGGTNNAGTIFKMMPDGTGYAKLFDFALSTTGGFPQGSLTTDGTFFYGMTLTGGTSGFGTIFKILPNGTGFAKLLDFTGGTNGGVPYGDVISDGTFLYGLTFRGATNDNGSIFKIMPDGSGYVKILDFTLAANGAYPQGSLISVGTFLYGMTYSGGTNNLGTIFKIKQDGTGYAKLLDFAGAANGNRPWGSLVFDGTFLYGMTELGGSNNAGVIFKIKPDGTSYLKLLDFAGATNGANPQGSLISDGTFLYGMTPAGGSNNLGTILKIMPDGTGYTKLLDFAGAPNGSNPLGSLMYDGTFLFGMTQAGGTNNLGTIFKIMPDGSGYAKLLDFTGTANGSSPRGDLITDGTFLYGMTQGGGSSVRGTIFRIMPNGTSYSKLLDFTGIPNGTSPTGSFIYDGTFLYGMTPSGGTSDFGILFKIRPNGGSYAKLFDFGGLASGSRPWGSLLSDGTFFYGTTQTGGTNNYGTVFKFLIPPAPPTITSFTPSSASAGTTVTITGLNFTGATAVRFGGTAATSFTIVSATSITAVIAGGTSGSVSVTTPAGTGSLAGFTFILCTPPPAPTANPVDRCGPGIVPLTATGAIGAQEYRWYNVPSGGTSLASTANYTTPSITVTTTYHVTIFDIATGCESAIRTPVDAMVLTPPPVPGAIDNSGCSGSSITLIASGASPGQYRWYTVATGGTPHPTQQNNTFSTPAITTNTNYWVAINDGACESGRQMVTATTIPLPASPLAPNPAPVCPGNTTTLTASGTTNGNYRWYDGAVLMPLEVNNSYVSPPLTANHTYGVAIFDGTCESLVTSITASVQVCSPPVITTNVSAPFLPTVIRINLLPLLSDPENNIDLSTLQIISGLPSGATATIEGNELVINYNGLPFPGTETIVLRVCDLTGQCSLDTTITINLSSDIIIFNAISPNRDTKNETLFIENIDILPDTKKNKVTIFNRWGSMVFEVSDYDNVNNVFRGVGNNGSDLPPGTYYYTLEFSSGAPKRTGFISLRK